MVQGVVKLYVKGYDGKAQPNVYQNGYIDEGGETNKGKVSADLYQYSGSLCERALIVCHILIVCTANINVGANRHVRIK